jgi:hypothetical protein
MDLTAVSAARLADDLRSVTLPGNAVGAGAGRGCDQHFA